MQQVKDVKVRAATTPRFSDNVQYYTSIFFFWTRVIPYFMNLAKAVGKSFAEADYLWGDTADGAFCKGWIEE